MTIRTGEETKWEIMQFFFDFLEEFRIRFAVQGEFVHRVNFFFTFEAAWPLKTFKNHSTKANLKNLKISLDATCELPLISISTSQQFPRKSRKKVHHFRLWSIARRFIELSRPGRLMNRNQQLRPDFCAQLVVMQCTRWRSELIAARILSFRTANQSLASSFALASLEKG